MYNLCLVGQMVDFSSLITVWTVLYEVRTYYEA